MDNDFTVNCTTILEIAQIRPYMSKVYKRDIQELCATMQTSMKHHDEHVTGSRRVGRRLHKAIAILNPFNGETCELDEEIFELIDELWKANIITVMSCQNNVPEDYIWIQFDNGEHMDKFIEILTRGRDMTDDLTTRITRRNIAKNWMYDHQYYFKTSIEIVVSVRFHKDDYEEVLKRFKIHNGS
jgi:hypothetical protein